MTRFARILQTLLGAALLTGAPALFAAHPSARGHVRMVYNPVSATMILFGGATPTDGGTRLSYDLNETWEWNGSFWIQRFPANVPPGRSSFAMGWDSIRSRAVIYGGKSGKDELDDTWAYKAGDWTNLAPPNTPGKRILPSAAFDPLRDRLVMFGGTRTAADGKSVTPLYDTWEFDGTTWVRRNVDGPPVQKPILVYDEARNQMLMMAVTDKLVSKMYLWDSAAGSWTELKPANLPACVNESGMVYQNHNQRLLLTGGICSGSSVGDQTFEWDGTNWSLVEVKSPPDRIYGQAIAYDVARQTTVEFGGTVAYGGQRSVTNTYTDGIWLPVEDEATPGPRSLFLFRSDPARGAIWLLGGQTDADTFLDFWKYQNGHWERAIVPDTPSCVSPAGAYDTDRQTMVVVCATSETFEFDGAAWKKLAPKDAPPVHRFSSMVYDQTLKKTVFFGGYSDVDANYLDETWLWDGTNWTRQKRNPPGARSLASLWYDATLKKTVVYGGIGRLSSQDRITRYSDMWSFDGNGWTEMKGITTPGTRYGAQSVVDPRTNHLLLFGGLRVDTVALVQTQVYANDLWDWDGASWKQVVTSGQTPPARENGALEYDPATGQVVLFAGYAGSFLSDLWALDANNNWTLRAESSSRRRTARRR